MVSMRKGPGGETRSPAHLGRDTAAILLNATRRQRDVLDQNHIRPVHRPGVIAEGRFSASGDLAPYCRTPALSAGTSRAVVRFSSFGAKEWAWKPDVRGMACRLTAEERPEQDRDTAGRHLDLVAVSTPRFVVRRAADFIAAPKGDEVLKWLVWAFQRRTTFWAVLTLYRYTKRSPFSHWNRHLTLEHYFGINTFYLENGGDERAMRYHWRPIDPVDPKVDDHVDGLRKQVADPDNPVCFELVVDILDDDAPYRKLHDALRRWPMWPREWLPVVRKRARWRDTTRVIAGRLELIDAPVDDDHPALERWVFNPVPEIGGFMASDDELLQARGSAYTASHVERRTAAEMGQGP